MKKYQTILCLLIIIILLVIAFYNYGENKRLEGFDKGIEQGYKTGYSVGYNFGRIDEEYNIKFEEWIESGCLEPLEPPLPKPPSPFLNID